MASVSSTTATFLECGGKRSATPLSSAKRLARGKAPSSLRFAGAVQKKSTKRCPKRIRSFVVSLKSKTKSQPRNKSMNTQTDTKTESRSGKNNGAPASIVWFEIPADNVERAKTFYGKLFGWKIERFPGRKAVLAHRYRRRRCDARRGNDGEAVSRTQLHKLCGCTLGRGSGGQGRKTWRQNLHGKDGRAGDGLLRCLSGHGEQYLCAVGAERKGEIVVLKRIARSS